MADVVMSAYTRMDLPGRLTARRGVDGPDPCGWQGAFMSEFDGHWRKSSYSQGGSCVEVRRRSRNIQVRDSKDPQSPVLTFTPQEWVAFVLGVCDGEFDVPVPQDS